MRYMGTLDPVVRSQLVVQASTMPDADAAEYLSILETTNYGKRKVLERYGLGAAAGLALGVAFAFLRKRR